MSKRMKSREASRFLPSAARTVIMSGVVAAVAVFSSPAAAAGCNCGTIRGYHQETRNYLADRIREAADRIIEALKGHSAQNSAFQDKQIEANKRIADAEQVNDTMRERMLIRAEAESGKFDPNPVACLIASLFQGGGSPGAGGGNGSDAVNAFATWSSGAHPAVMAGGAALGKFLTDQQKSMEGKSTDFSIPYQHPTMPDGDPALQAMVNNLLMAAPPRPITEKEATTPAGVAEVAKREQVNAALRASAQGLAFSLNMRTPVGPAGPYQALLQKESAPGAYNNPIPETISELQQLDIRTVARYAPNDAALIRRGQMNEKALLMEIVDELSIANRLAYMNVELESRNAAALAAITGLLADGKLRTIAPQ